MTYFQLRLRIYQEELKQMLSSIKQMLVFLMLLLQIALPVAILTSLISLSIIESSTTSIHSRISYQWGYLSFLFLLISVQKKAIFGEVYQLYLSSIPVSKIQTYCSNIFLVFCAGNLPLLIPLLLLILNIDSAVSKEHLYFSLFVLATLFTTLLSVKGRQFPWLSLLFFPVLIMFYANDLPEYFTSTTLNYCWLMMFVIDYFYKPIIEGLKPKIPLKHYLQIKWVEIKNDPNPLLSRILICGLLMILVRYVQSELETIALISIQIAVCYLLSLLIGSFQFDNEKFSLKYRLYLNSILVNKRKRYMLDTLPAIFIACVTAITLHNVLLFSFISAISVPVGTAITILSVTFYQRNFFIFPSLAFIVLFACL